MGAKTVTLWEAWSRDTSSDPDKWTEENPSWGQCAISALVIQDLLGGELLRSTVNGISHYWNKLPNGAQIDITIQQFGEVWARGEIKVRSREYVLSFPETARRYELLKSKLTSGLGNH